MLLGRGERKIRQFFSESARLSGIFGICPVEHSLSIHPESESFEFNWYDVKANINYIYIHKA